MTDLTHIAKSLQPLAVPTDKLKPDPSNVRKHSEKNIRAVMASLRKFGQQKPIVALKSGRVIAGNGTLEAAQRLAEGSKELGLRPDPRWERLAVSRFANKADAVAYAIADNRTAELAEWHYEGLADQLRDMDDDLAGFTGFDTTEAEAIIRAWEPAEEQPPEPPADDDNIDGINTDGLPLPETGDTIKVGRHSIQVGDCVAALKDMASCSVDSIVCDPPYGIGFMGKGWDCAIPSLDWAKECLRVLKPGGHLIAFAATRTMHRLGVAVEDAGFEIRDQIAWLQWQGFPKSLDISKAIDSAAGAERVAIGQGTSWNKPDSTDGDTARMNASPASYKITAPATNAARQWQGWGTALKPSQEPALLARKPLEGTVAKNVQAWGTGGLNIDGCRFQEGDKAWPGPDGESELGRWPSNLYQCPKPARSEKETGLDELGSVTGAEAVSRKAGSKGLRSPRAGAGRTAANVKNIHPTVKPIGLMRWLVRLVTPPGGTVLDTFLGSGTTMVAAEREGFTCVGVEMDPEYARISHARVAHIAEAGTSKGK